MKNFKSKLMAWVLMFALVFCTMPVVSFADENEGGAETVTSQDVSASQDNQQDADQTGNDQTGADQTGADQTGADQTGADQTGADQNGDDQNGENQNGDGQNGDDQNGADQNGENQNGDDQNGENQNGDDQNGENQNGDDQTGDDQTGDDQNGADQNGNDQNGNDQNGTDQNGTDQNGADQNGTDQNGADQNGTDQNGTDQNGTDQNGTDQNGADQNGADQNGTDQNGNNQAGENQNVQQDAALNGAKPEEQLNADNVKMQVKAVKEEVPVEVPEVVQQFLDAVAALPEAITADNYEESKPAIQAVDDAYSAIWAEYEADNGKWAEFRKCAGFDDAYSRYQTMNKEIEAAELAVCPFEGVWQDGCLTITGINGNDAYNGTFALVENGQRVKLSGRNDLRKMTGSFSVKLEGISELGQSAFYSCKNLTEVDLGDVTSIGKYAFQDCSSLRAINLANVTTIYDQAFYRAFDPTADVIIELSNASIGNHAFRESGIAHLKADGITAIGTWGFSGSQLQDVELSIVEGAELGEALFNVCNQLTTVRFSGDAVVKYMFRQCAKLESVEILNATEIAPSAFIKCPQLTTVSLPDSITSIGYQAFRDCPKLNLTGLPANLATIDYEAFQNTGLTGDLDLSKVEYIGFNAFSNNAGISSIIVSDNTVLEHSNIFADKLVGYEGRVAAILAGQFSLAAAANIDTLLPEGWTSHKLGESNNHTDYGTTQLTKEAKWSNADQTRADVLLQAYYSDNAQMDFIFVIDLSNSMNKVGNADVDNNARIYDAQSKLLDVTSKLMTTPGYDCRVAFADFGETNYNSSGEFFADADSAAGYIKNELKAYYENTNYGLGMQEALKLLNGNKGRNTTVVFISDGQPYAGKDKPIPDSYYGYGYAEQIKAAGAEIYAVLQSVPEGELANAQSIMEQICTNGRFFTAKQTDEFSQAVNDAIACGFGDYTLVDVVGADFELDPASIKASTGEVRTSTDENGNTVITWTITGMPFETHTLNFSEMLKPVNGEYPVGNFLTNNGPAVLNTDEETVNTVESPELGRTARVPVVTEAQYRIVHEYYTNNVLSGSTEDSRTAQVNTVISGANIDRVLEYNGNVYTFTSIDAESITVTEDGLAVITLRYDRTVSGDDGGNDDYDEPDTTPIADNQTPTTGEPEETTAIDDGEVPMSELPEDEEEEIFDEDVPMSDVPKTGDSLLLWFFAAAASGLAALAAGRKRK